MTEVHVHPNVTLVVTAGAERGLRDRAVPLPRRHENSGRCRCSDRSRRRSDRQEPDLRRRWRDRARLRQRSQPARRGQARRRRGWVDVLASRRRHRSRRHGIPDRRRAAVRSRHGVAVFIDPDLLQYGVVWAAAGTWTDVFAITPDDLLRASDATVTRTSPYLTTDQSVGGGGSSIVWSNIAGSTVMNRPVPRATTVSSGPDGSTSSPSMSNLRP